MSDQDAANAGGPWWASGRTPEDGIDGAEDPLSAHGRARAGNTDDGDGDSGLPDLGRLAGEVIEVLVRAASETGRRMSARATSNAGTDDDPPATPHEDGAVCDACPVCIALGAVRDIRPEAVSHLAEAAHHVSLALQAFADAQASGPDDLQKIDLDL